MFELDYLTQRLTFTRADAGGPDLIAGYAPTFAGNVAELPVAIGEPLAAERQPLRVVIGLRPVPAIARVLDASAPTLLLRTRDLREVLAELAAGDVQHVLLEGGPTLAGAFVAAGLVDQVVAYLAPALLGDGPAALGSAGISTLASALRLQPDDVTRFGPDVRITARVVRAEEA